MEVGYAYRQEIMSSSNLVGSPSQRSVASTNALTNTVLNEKRARKAAEEDALRLYNRVRQLEKEEDKAQKRIEETRKRAQDILRLRQRNEQKQSERELRLRQLQLEIAQQRELISQMKDESRRQKEDHERTILEQRIETALQARRNLVTICRS